MNRKETGEPLVDVGASGGIGRDDFVLETGSEGQSVALSEPVGITTMTPGGDVDVVDGATVEVLHQDSLDFGERVEPFENGFYGMAIEETAVELLTDFVGKAGDFAGVGHGCYWLRGYMVTSLKRYILWEA